MTDTDVDVVALEAHLRTVALAPTGGDGRTVEVQLVRWDTPHRVSDDGRTFYDEVFARGGLRVMPGARVLARNEHDPAEFPATATAGSLGVDPGRAGIVVGQLTGTHSRADGLYGTIRLVDNEDGARLRGLIDPTEPIIDSLSIEFDDVYRPIRGGETVVRSDARLTGLVFTLNPARGDARVLAVRTTTQETPPMDETAAPVVPPAPSDDTTTQQSTVTVPLARTVARPGDVAPALGGDYEVAEAHRYLAQFRTFGEYARARATSRDPEVWQQSTRSLFLATEAGVARRRHARVFEDATTADIAGLLPTQWLSEVIDLYMVLAPTVANWSTSPLPPDGMTVSQPIVGDRPTPAVQTNQYDLPTSNKVTVTSSSWSILTYAGGQGMSIQASRAVDAGVHGRRHEAVRQGDGEGPQRRRRDDAARPGRRRQRHRPRVRRPPRRSRT
jgi:hypothetical protein